MCVRHKSNRVCTCLLKVSSGLGLDMYSTNMSSMRPFFALDAFREVLPAEVEGTGAALPGVLGLVWLRLLVTLLLIL